jgi:hypothetical protein
MAVKFATAYHRHKADDPVLLQTRIVRGDALAFFSDRGETEVLINPERLRHIVSVTRL